MNPAHRIVYQLFLQIMLKSIALNFRYVLASLFCLLFIGACKKGPGEGGSSTIKGKVTATYIDVFDNQYSYPAEKEDVYIIYGDGDYYGDNVETDFNGNYEFKNLRKGDYTVYAYSDCDTCINKHQVAELKKVEITKNKSDVTADINIIKR